MPPTKKAAAARKAAPAKKKAAAKKLTAAVQRPPPSAPMIEQEDGEGDEEKCMVDGCNAPAWQFCGYCSTSYCKYHMGEYMHYNEGCDEFRCGALGKNYTSQEASCKDTKAQTIVLDQDQVVQVQTSQSALAPLTTKVAMAPSASADVASDVALSTSYDNTHVCPTFFATYPEQVEDWQPVNKVVAGQ
jgi:hypothetical protein